RASELQRSDKPARIPLFHGDIVVWGGEDRMRFHGIMPLKAAEHPRVGARRINLTFRRAGQYDQPQANHPNGCFVTATLTIYAKIRTATTAAAARLAGVFPRLMARVPIPI